MGILTDAGPDEKGLLRFLLQAGLVFLGQVLKTLELGRVILRPVSLLSRILG